MSERSARDVVEEMFRRQEAGDDAALDDLVAEDMVNHAAGPQGRSGLAQTLSTIDHDLGRSPSNSTTSSATVTSWLSS